MVLSEDPLTSLLPWRWRHLTVPEWPAKVNAAQAVLVRRFHTCNKITTYDLPYSGLFSWGTIIWLMDKSRDFPPMNFMITYVRCTTLNGLGDLLTILWFPRYRHRIDNAVDSHGPLSQADPRVMIGEVNQEVKKAETDTNEKARPVPLVDCG